jgi:hypothetical protein
MRGFYFLAHAAKIWQDSGLVTRSISGPETLTAWTALVGMSYLAVASGGTHGIQAPVNRGGGLSIFPEIRAPDEGAK